MKSYNWEVNVFRTFICYVFFYFVKRCLSDGNVLYRIVDDINSLLLLILSQVYGLVLTGMIPREENMMVATKDSNIFRQSKNNEVVFSSKKTCYINDYKAL